MLSAFAALERMLVFPAPRMNGADWNPEDLAFEDVFFMATDGTRLHGWFIPHEAPRAAVLYCHGNGEYVARLAPRLRILHEAGVAVFAWDYRSYGKSLGKPTAELTISDARDAQLWLAKRLAIDAAEVVALGRSLGGGVAVGLAAKYAVRGLVLERTFTRLTDVGVHLFPWLPVRWIMRNDFPSIDRIRQYHGPLLQVHGTEDRVVPYAMGRELFEACPSTQKQFFTVEGGDHNGPQPPEYDELLREWLVELPAVADAARQDRCADSRQLEDHPR